MSSDQVVAYRVSQRNMTDRNSGTAWAKRTPIIRRALPQWRQLIRSIPPTNLFVIRHDLLGGDLHAHSRLPPA
jgi:hypothetical protein